MRVLLREAAGYAVASVCALLLDMSVLYCLVHYGQMGYELAACISFMSGAVVAYRVSIAVAFKRHRLRDRRAEFASFVAIGLVGLAVNAVVMYRGGDGLRFARDGGEMRRRGIHFHLQFFV